MILRLVTFNDEEQFLVNVSECESSMFDNVEGKAIEMAIEANKNLGVDPDDLYGKPDPDNGACTMKVICDKNNYKVEAVDWKTLSNFIVYRDDFMAMQENVIVFSGQF